MATPALRALRRGFGSSRIAYLGRRIALETLEGLNWSDEVLADRSIQRPRIRNFFSMVGTLRRGHFDLGVLLPNSFRSAALARMGKVKRLAGYDRDGRGWLLTDKLGPQRDDRGGFKPVPTVDYYLDLIKMLGAAPEGRQMALAVTPAGEAQAEAMLAEAAVDARRPLIMLNPGASFGSSKMWPPQRFAALADALTQRQGAQIIINAAPVERPIAAAVVAAMKHKPAISFADRDNTIGLLKSLIRRCTMLITNDTGARHFAAAFGIDLVTLFGSTDPVWAQIDYPRERIVRVNVPCSPCQSKACVEPPGPTYHQCMTAITVEMVLAAAEGLLAESKVPT